MKGEDRKEGKKPGRPRWGVDEGLARSHGVCPTLGTPPHPASSSMQPRQCVSRARGPEPESDAPPSGSRTTFPSPD